MAVVIVLADEQLDLLTEIVSQRLADEPEGHTQPRAKLGRLLAALRDREAVEPSFDEMRAYFVERHGVSFVERFRTDQLANPADNP